VDPFTPKGAEIRGVVLVHYANFGRVTVLLLNPIVWALVLLAAVVLLVWWSGDTCDDDPDDKDNDERADGGDPESEPDEEPDLIDRMVEGTEAAIARMVSSGADAGAAVLAMLTRPSPVPRHAARAPRYRAPAYLRVSAIVAVVGLASVFGLSPASASSLTITTKGNIFTHTYTPCTTATLRADPATRTTGTYYTQLVVSAIPQLCNGKPITMFAYDAAGKLLMSSTLSTSSDPEGKTGTSGTVTFTKNTGSYSAASVSKVLVFIDTWGIQTTWTYTPPVTGPYSCVPADNVPSALSVGTCVPDRVPHQNWGEWGDNRHHVMTTYLHVDVAAGTANAIVTLDLSQAPFPTWTVRAIMGNLDWIPVPGYSCSELPIVRLYANPGKGGVSKDIYLMLAEDANYFGTGAGQPARICPSG
jgi:hypothetical protein